jgi:hypothetical protein
VTQQRVDLPRDLDLAVRLNVRLLASELGEALAQRLLLETLAGAHAASDSPWLARALAQSELLWLGLRAGASLAAAEKVLILRGHFANLLPPTAISGSEWTAAAQSTGRPHWSRDGSPPGAFTRLYSAGEELLVLASAAEAPGLERLLEQGREDPASLRPPERGVVSAAARPARLRELYLDPYPQLAARLTGFRLLQAYVEPGATELALELELGFETPEQALSAADVFEKLRQELQRRPCALGVLAQAAHISTFERRLSLLAQLRPEQVDGLEACVLAGRCCD